MASPRRFFGSGEPIEIDDVIIPARCAVEVTFCTHQHRCLLRPDHECNEILLGCFGRAYHRYPGLNLNILKILSTHGHFIAVPDNAKILSDFMRDFLSDSATRLNTHRDRKGTLWERRYRGIPILDEAKMDERFRYVLTHGTKENLVWSAKDWPGVSSVNALLGGPELVGRWLDGTATGELEKQRERKLERAAARGREREIAPVLPVWRQYPIELVPMPHWTELKPGQMRTRVATMLRDDDAITKLRHRRQGTSPCGVKAVLSTNPTQRPTSDHRSPAPPCHASTARARKAYRTAYTAFVDVCATASKHVKTKLQKCGVPAYATVAPQSNCDPPPPVRPQPPLIDSHGKLVAEPTGPPATGPPRS